jgi:hypothetical protein
MRNSHENLMPQDMRDALDKFSKESQEAIEAFLDQWKPQSHRRLSITAQTTQV